MKPLIDTPVLVIALLLASSVFAAEPGAPPVSLVAAAAPAPAVVPPAADLTPAADDAAVTAEQAASTPAEAPVVAEPGQNTRALDEEIQAIKKDVVDLNRDLFVLEEELLFPANTQVAVFLSMDVGAFFALDTVELRIDDKQVNKYLYTPREAEALLKGGVQRLFLGNLRVGKHELVALFNGKGPNGQDYSRGAQLKFEKSVGAKYLELRISDRQRKQQPEFEIKDWE
jgi:hypothetical protein